VTQILYFLLFYITVEQQSCVLLFCKLFFMDFLKIFNQIVNLRDVQKFSYDVRWLNKTQGQNILLYGSRVIVFRVKKISM
jgi:hypothetical protein